MFLPDTSLVISEPRMKVDIIRQSTQNFLHIMNNNNNNLYLKRVTRVSGEDLPRGLLACLHVAQGPQGYKVVQYIAFRHRDLMEGRDGAHLLASVKPFQTMKSQAKPSKKGQCL